MADAPVLMYLCDVKFSGATAVRYEKAPKAGAAYRCVLLVRESEAGRINEILKELGWEPVGVASRPFDSDSLKEPSMQPFRQHYDAALKDGHSLVWYSDAQP
jgi:hypothetical protein